MTSVLNVDTIADKAGTGPVALTKQQAAKVYARMSSTGVTQSLNTSGFTDNGTGDYTVTFTSAFTNNTFAGTTSTVGASSRVAAYSSALTTGIDVDAFTTTSGSRVDSATAFDIHGDLA